MNGGREDHPFNPFTPCCQFSNRIGLSRMHSYNLKQNTPIFVYSLCLLDNYLKLIV